MVAPLCPSPPLGSPRPLLLLLDALLRLLRLLLQLADLVPLRGQRHARQPHLPLLGDEARGLAAGAFASKWHSHA